MMTIIILVIIVTLFQFNSIGVNLRANLTAHRPITKIARIERNTQKYFKKIQYMIVYNNYTNNTNNYAIFKNRLGRTFLVPNTSIILLLIIITMTTI
jgi:hypothetical protein